jgi:hypothetical protein
MTNPHLILLIQSRLHEEIAYLRQRADDQTRAPTDSDFLRGYCQGKHSAYNFAASWLEALTADLVAALDDHNTATTGEPVALPGAIADQPTD